MNFKTLISAGFVGAMLALVTFHIVQPAPAQAYASAYVTQTIHDYAVSQYVAQSAITASGGSVNGPINNSSYFRSTAGNGQPAFVSTANGARWCFNDLTCTAYMSFGAGSLVSFVGGIPSAARYEASTGSGNNAYAVAVTGARIDVGAGTNDYIVSDATAVTTPSYGIGPGTAAQFAGAPTAADCDADAERGRIALDTTNNRLYICNGASRAWDYVALTD